MNGTRKSTVYLIAIFICITIFLSSCNMPRNATPTQSGINLISTYAAQTVQAKLTEVSQPPVLLESVTPDLTSSAPAHQTPVGTTAAPLDSTCNQAAFVQDVSVPDNTEFDPGAPFVKTWRLQNDGTCTWTANYNLFFDQGDQLGAPDSVPIGVIVSPGETVDVSVNMQAPEVAGSYKGEWKLRSETNEIFGTGSGANPIWVKILVVTAHGMDFVAQAPAADWRSGSANQPWTPLGFGGDINDPNGVAKIVNGVKLENNRISGNVLLTYPKHDPTGWTSGVYESYLIQSGNHFEARIGFMTNQDGNCGAGNVIFQLRYKEGDNLTELGRWEKSCDGRLQYIDLDLSRIAGKTVQFVLTVRANGSYIDDWAVWNSPQITK